SSDAKTREATVRLAQILKERHGDGWLAEMVGSIDATSGLQQLAAARTGNLSSHADAAIAAAREAQQSFRRSGSKPGMLWARFEEVAGLRGQLRSDQCLPLAETLVRDLDAHPYVWLRAQARIESADCAMRL